MSLARPIPLKRSTHYSAYQVDAVIPHVYGRARVNAIPYLDRDKWFIVSNHPVGNVYGVWSSGKKITAYQPHTITDELGETITVIELLSKAQSITVDLDGKLNGTGGVIRNPIDITEDLLKLAGVSVAPERFTNLRAATQDYECSFVLKDSSATARSIITGLLGSLGIEWSLGLMSVGRIYPAYYNADKSLSAHRIKSPQATIEADTIYDRLVLSYDRDYSTDKPQKTLTLAVHNGTAGATKEWSCPHIASNRSAEIVGRRLLQYYSMPRYNVSFETDETTIEPTDVLSITVPAFDRNKSYECFVSNSQVELLARKSRITGEIVVGYSDDTPITLVGLSAIYQPTTSDIAYVYDDGKLTITARKPDGSGISGAVVRVAGQERPTNNEGKAVFLLGSGTYKVSIVATGYADINGEITI